MTGGERYVILALCRKAKAAGVSSEDIYSVLLEDVGYKVPDAAEKIQTKLKEIIAKELAQTDWR